MMLICLHHPPSWTRVTWKYFEDSTKKYPLQWGLWLLVSSLFNFLQITQTIQEKNPLLGFYLLPQLSKQNAIFAHLGEMQPNWSIGMVHCSSKQMLTRTPKASQPSQSAGPQKLIRFDVVIMILCVISSSQPLVPWTAVFWHVSWYIHAFHSL